MRRNALQLARQCNNLNRQLSASRATDNKTTKKLAYTLNMRQPLIGNYKTTMIQKR